MGKEVIRLILTPALGWALGPGGNPTYQGLGLLVQGAFRSPWPVGPMLAASSAPLLPAGTHFEGSCCLQNKTRTPRACASLCPVAGRSQTPCAWALSSLQQASCERTLSPLRRTPAGPQRCLWEMWERQQAGAPSGQDSGAHSAAPHAPPVVFLPCK